MAESQPDMLGGKTVPASRIRRQRSHAKPPVRREGWAGTPGNGPEGETCGSCTYCVVFQFRKAYNKCSARPGDHWKGGRATDIRPLDPACEKWAPTAAAVNLKKAKEDGRHQLEQAHGGRHDSDVGQGAPVRTPVVARTSLSRPADRDSRQLTLDV